KTFSRSVDEQSRQAETILKFVGIEIHKSY
ncbi:MAG: hypothetical protein RJA79_816, partial [Actinomycetota bacterium]